MYAAKGEAPNFNFDVNFERGKLIAWAGLCGNGGILGPFFFDGNVNGRSYLEMINNLILPASMRNYNILHIPDVNGIWWAQDGAPAHVLRQVRNRLQNVFHQNVIARGHQIAWTARSPDLTPRDYFLWGYIKNNLLKTWLN